jgi:hypothetical protein
MATQTYDAHAAGSHHLARDAAILLLAVAAAFFLGRVSSGAQEARGGTTAPHAQSARQPGGATPEPGWKAQGCRDGDTVDDICTDPACNG